MVIANTTFHYQEGFFSCCRFQKRFKLKLCVIITFTVVLFIVTLATMYDITSWHAWHGFTIHENYSDM